MQRNNKFFSALGKIATKISFPLKGLVIVGLPLCSLSMFPLAAMANNFGTFSFNKFVSDVWVGEISVEQGVMAGKTYNSCDYSGGGSCAGPYSSSWTAEATKISVPLSIPSCPNQYHTEGKVTIKYTNGEAHITKTYQINRDNEGIKATPSWTTPGYYGNPSDGHINVSGQVSCVYHGVGGGIFDW
jgi:hypothetical protein